MGHGGQKGLAFMERLADQAKLEILKVALPAVKELGRGGRGALRKVTLFGQGYGQATASGVTGDAAAIDAAADDRDIER